MTSEGLEKLVVAHQATIEQLRTENLEGLTQQSKLRAEMRQLQEHYNTLSVTSEELEKLVVSHQATIEQLRAENLEGLTQLLKLQAETRQVIKANANPST